MTKLEQILVFIYRNYPNPSELSKARLVKIIYLSDWKFALEFGSQISDIRWYFNHYGPFVKEVIEQIRQSHYFEIIPTQTANGNQKEIIRLKSFVPRERLLLIDEENIILGIINVTSKFFFDDFIKLVYSTYPVVVSEKYTYLDLVGLAVDYKRLKRAAVM